MCETGGRQGKRYLSLLSEKEADLSMLNTTNISALLRWAMENIGYPIDEINALDWTVHIRLSDGRTGFLYMG